MKQNIIYILILIFLVSCGANPQKHINKLMDNVHIGMPISEFKEKVKGEQLVEMNSKITIYKVVKQSYNELAGVRQDYRFFYFTDGKLDKVDKGERAVDLRIKID